MPALYVDNLSISVSYPHKRGELVPCTLALHLRCQAGQGMSYGEAEDIIHCQEEASYYFEEGDFERASDYYDSARVSLLGLTEKYDYA
jgi:hypothetical protein